MVPEKEEYHEMEKRASCRVIIACSTFLVFNKLGDWHHDHVHLAVRASAGLRCWRWCLHRRFSCGVRRWAVRLLHVRRDAFFCAP